MVFKKGSKPINHKEGCTCFRCSKVPWNRGRHDLPPHTEEWKKKVSNKLKGRILTEEHKKKVSNARRGMKFSEEHKKNMSISKMGQVAWNKGIPCSEETKLKNRLSHLGKPSWNKGRTGEKSHWFNRHHTEETKQKLRLLSTGRHHTPEAKLKISQVQKGSHHSKEQIRKMSQSLKLAYKEGRKKIVTNLKHHMPHTQETKKKLRLATINYFRDVCGGMNPMLGHNETAILDFFEQTIGYRVARQICIEGFFLDGYIPELNFVVEIDEKYHKKREERDKIRDAIIKNKLNCEFLRIKDYD